MDKMNIINAKFTLFCLFAVLVLSLAACETDGVSVKVPDDGQYAGTFYAPNYNLEQDSVFLTISNGYYRCDTQLPFNYGAGRLEVTGTTLNFVDTLFFVVPALYVTGFALSGEYTYHFNDGVLQLEKVESSSKLTYQLVKVANIAN
jgi:hypothetical protein